MIIPFQINVFLVGFDGDGEANLMLSDATLSTILIQSENNHLFHIFLDFDLLLFIFNFSK
jgi:hypothetical protein